MPRNCNCAGGQCGPQGEEPPDDDAAAGVSRREFISLASIGAAGVALAGGAPGTAPADLAEWKASLMKPSAPRKYRSDVHRDAKMHLGGIGTGNFEIGVD
ncbi:MAG TPA: twin-arginine translocation signal domain-containing protein, partial [Chthonomonadaceae bacterium]|nr:twin-arginine translocation signal domain-containing protein [Chthonomonadaceae bacterium]